jgi:phospholipase C
MAEISRQATLTRRRLLQAGGAALLAYGLGGPLTRALTSEWLRKPDSLPYPSLAAGEATAAFPFDHIVVLMMENHSFDGYFGMLPKLGQPQADGFRFDGFGKPANRNPLGDGYVEPYRATSQCQGSVTQSWNSTHKQINGGRMDGFAATDRQAMVYWTDDELPFYYSLAKEFTLANRWFGSAPCQTYPNRRFLLAGTAYGNISTDTGSISDPPPPNGTIFDRLSAHGISWRNYFTDLPQTGIIPSIIEKYPANLGSIATFFADCALGTLPSVSFVDPEFGVLGEVGGPLSSVPLPPVAGLGSSISPLGGSEENPQNIDIGQQTAALVVNAVLNSPAWPRTLFVWAYDEHGGYYDHVPPPRAIKPDSIPPKLKPTDIPGEYDIYGPRVPAVVASPYSKPGGVSNVVCDHTSVLATIEAQWNLPAMTYRDANAATLADFLAPGPPALLHPPALAAAPDPLVSQGNCDTSEPNLPVVTRWHA